MLRKLRHAQAILIPGRVKFFFRKLRHPIPPGALVLDVGSGGDPHPRADVIVDRHILGSGQRTAAFRQEARLGLVVADIHKLPFRSGAFGFSICSHVLEHVADPAKAASELSRVSSAGYVETPSSVLERLIPLGWHLWCVSKRDSTLRFDAKTAPFLDEDVGNYFRSRWGRDPQFMRFFWSHLDDLMVQHYWKGTLSVETHGVPSGPPPDWLDEAGAEVGHGDNPAGSAMKRRLYEALCAFRYRR